MLIGGGIAHSGHHESNEGEAWLTWVAQRHVHAPKYPRAGTHALTTVTVTQKHSSKGRHCHSTLVSQVPSSFYPRVTLVPSRQGQVERNDG